MKGIHLHKLTCNIRTSVVLEKAAAGPFASQRSPLDGGERANDQRNPKQHTSDRQMFMRSQKLSSLLKLALVFCIRGFK